jgi:hypothetical protein
MYVRLAQPQESTDDGPRRSTRSCSYLVLTRNCRTAGPSIALGEVAQSGNYAQRPWAVAYQINIRRKAESASVTVKKEVRLGNRTRCLTPESGTALPTRGRIAGYLQSTEGTPPDSTIAASWLRHPACTCSTTSSNCPLLKESERSRVQMRLKSAFVWLQTQGELSDDPGHAQGRLARRKWWPLLKSSDMEIVSGREIHWRYVSPM